MSYLLDYLDIKQLYTLWVTFNHKSWINPKAVHRSGCCNIA